MAASVKTHGEDVLVGTGTLCHYYGITPAALDKWRKGGCPRHSRGWYNLREVREWKDGGTTTDPVKTGDLRTAKMAVDLQYRKTKSEREKLLLEILRGEYFSKDEAVTEWTTRALELKISLLDWSKTLPIELVGKNADEIERELYDRVCELLEGFCRSGQYVFNPQGD